MYDWLDKLLEEDEKELKEISFPRGKKLEKHFRNLKEVKKFIEKSKFTGIVRAKSRIENVFLLYLQGELAGAATFSRLGLYTTFGEKALSNILDSSFVIESIEEYNHEELYSTLISNPEMVANKNLQRKIFSISETIDTLPPETVGLLEMLVFSEGAVQRELLRIVSLSVFLSDFGENDFNAAIDTIDKLDFVTERNGGYEISSEYKALLRQIFLKRAKVEKARELIRTDQTTSQLLSLLADTGKVSYSELKKFLGGEVDTAISKLVSLGALFRGVDSSGLPTVFLPKALHEQLLAERAEENQRVEEVELSREELMKKLNIREPTDEDIEAIVRSILEESEDELEALHPLIEALREGDARVRSVAASALAKIGDARAIEPLIHALFDEDNNVRVSAAKALGTLKSPKAVEPLIETLSDEDSAVRASAAKALGSIGDTRAIEPLISTLSDGDSTVRASAARALGSIGDERAIEPLIEAFYKEEDELARRDIISALSGYRDERILEIMIQCLKDRDAYVRRIAASALWKSGGERAIEPLIEALKDEESTVRYCAVSALDGVKDERVIEPLIGALNDNDDMVRTVAASALGKINDERAIEALKKALNDKSEWVRNCAAEALQNLGVNIPDTKPETLFEKKVI
jgi:HEAT repeat protein